MQPSLTRFRNIYLLHLYSEVWAFVDDHSGLAFLGNLLLRHGGLWAMRVVYGSRCIESTFKLDAHTTEQPFDDLCTHSRIANASHPRADASVDAGSCG